MALVVPPTAVIRDVIFAGTSATHGIGVADPRQKQINKVKIGSVTLDRGLTPSAGLNPVADPDPNKTFGVQRIETDHLKKPLFPGVFSLADSDDIVQGYIGDCFALAALLSLLFKWKGRRYIENMMCEEEVNVVVGGYSKRQKSGKVILRLYDGANTAHYLRLSKKILTTAGVESAEGEMALWAEIILQGLATSNCSTRTSFASCWTRCASPSPWK